MYLKNVLNPGDFVVLSPVGIRMTLQYNAAGNLEKVYMGYYAERVDVTESVMPIIIKSKTVPLHIHITKGTSWVRGVLYTGNTTACTGMLPQAVESELLSMYIKSPTVFNFFAATFDSTMASFHGATPTRQCLVMSRFRLLPGWLVPAHMNSEIFNTWINSSQFTFAKLVSEYIIFQKDSVKIVSTHLSQIIVNKVKKYVDDNGYVKASIQIKDSDKILKVDYSDVVRFNIRPNTLLILDGDNQIIYNKSLNSDTHSYSSLLTCSYCGKVYEIPTSGSVICSDIHCTSRLLPGILHFIKTLNLQTYDSKTIRSWIDNKDVTCIPDLFLLDEYKSVDVHTSLSALLRALVSVDLIPNSEIFRLLAVGCSNNIKTFKYYIQNPCQIAADLNIEHKDLPKLVSWLSNGYNVSDLATLLDTSQIHICNVDKKFDGAPIFRDKTIYITGDFIRGSVSEIAEILQSYSASVTTKFSDIVDCVLLGGQQSNVDGKSVSYARNLRIPIMTEEQFFKNYEIDEDLRSNLV